MADPRNVEAMETEDNRIHLMDDDQFKTYIKSLIVAFDGHRSLGGAKRAKGDSQDSDHYDFDHPRRGLAIIYNCEKFTGDTRRVGSSNDARNLEISFKSLGFDVLIFKDLKSHQMLLAAEGAAKWYRHDEADCVACVILSHGMEIFTTKNSFGFKDISHVVFGSDSRAVFCEDITSNFMDEKCAGLKDKPRLFFLQACRGGMMDQGVQLHEDNRDPDVVLGTTTLPPAGGRQEAMQMETRVKLVPHIISLDKPDGDPSFSEDEFAPEERRICVVRCTDRGFSIVMREPATDTATSIRMVQIPMYTDLLVMYATPPGYFAWRRDTGSWFITELCRFLRSEQVLEQSFFQGLTSVNRAVIHNYRSSAVDPSQSNMLQMPNIDTMLTKIIIMRPKPQHTFDLH